MDQLFKNKLTVYLLQAGTLALIIFLIAQAMVAFKEYKYVGSGLEAKNTISVTGKGEIFVVPDIASFSFIVKEEKKTAKDAQSVETKKINAIIDYLKKEGIDAKDIKTTNYNLYPRYEWKEDCRDFDVRGACNSTRVLIGYVVSQSVQVKIRDTDKAGKVLAQMATLGAENVSSLQFKVDDEDVLKEQARSKAIKNAKEKARKLASELGIKLVRVVSFSEGGRRDFIRPLYAKMAVENVSDMPMDEAPSLPLGENKINSSITITYEIQ